MNTASLRLRLIVTISIFYAVSGFLFLAGTAAAAPEGHLTLQKVVLFKNGVGYFQLDGKIVGGQGVALHFKRKEMNDLLKSLTIINLTQGHVKSVVYDSKRTTTQQLADFGFDLSPNAGLPQMLRQFQGNEVALTAGSTEISGRIVGVEKRLSMDADKQESSFLLSLLPSNGQLRTFRLDEITGIRFLSGALNQDLKRYLDIKSQGHLKDDKTLIITPSGEGLQDLVVSYVIEAPVWKATYRIVLPQGNKEKKPFIQGWAIVDNVTENDWDEVNLSLVSGLPVSFIQDLYNPRFKKRPMLKIEDSTGVAPSIPEVGMKKQMLKAAAPASMGRERLEAADGVQENRITSKAFHKIGDGLRNMAAQAAVREMGELFEYHITHPVSIKRNQSAMVPIVSKEMKGKAVDLYNAETRKENPLAAVKLLNTTDLTLEGGPLTVLSGDCYAGEAFLTTMKPGEHRYIPYAVDLGLRVNTKLGSKTEAVDRVVINRGLIRMHRGIVETKTYHLDNHNERAKTVIIEHPYHQGWKLLNKDQPLEITDNFLRFEVLAAPDQVTSFTVKELRDTWDSMMITNLNPDNVRFFARQGYLEEAVKESLKQLVHLKAEIAHLNEKLKALDKERKEIFEDQKRLRDNLRSLGKTVEEKALRSRYIEQMELQETRLKSINEEAKRLKKARSTKQLQLEEGIMALSQDLAL